MTRPFSALAGAVAGAVLLAAGAAPAQSPAPAPASSPGPQRLFADSRYASNGRISVEVVGEGPDLVFIPGLASSRETWRATAERLRGRYRLHLIQVAGFAGEPAGDNASGPVVGPVAEAIDAHLTGAHLAPAVVIGHSLGGTIALYLAEHHPEHVSKVLLVDALPWFAVTMFGPNATADNVTPIAEAIRHGPPQPEAATSRMIAAMVGGEADRTKVLGWSKASDPAVVAAALADDLELDLRPDLAKVRVPITLLYPDNTPLGAPAGAMDGFYAAAYAAAPVKTLLRVDKAQHFLMLDQPAAFAADLDAFLAK